MNVLTAVTGVITALVTIAALQSNTGVQCTAVCQSRGNTSYTQTQTKNINWNNGHIGNTLLEFSLFRGLS